MLAYPCQYCHRQKPLYQKDFKVHFGTINALMCRECLANPAKIDKMIQNAINKRIWNIKRIRKSIKIKRWFFENKVQLCCLGVLLILSCLR